jgi:hypothetical protein
MRKLIALLALVSLPALADELVAYAVQDDVRVDLFASPCVAPWPAAQVADGEKSMGQKLDAKRATYTEKGVKTEGCWLVHPAAPAVILLWEDQSGATVGMHVFTPGK